MTLLDLVMCLSPASTAAGSIPSSKENVGIFTSTPGRQIDSRNARWDQAAVYWWGRLRGTTWGLHEIEGGLDVGWQLRLGLG